MDGEGSEIGVSTPHLFNLWIANMEEVMRKVKWGGIKLGRKKVYTLAYADNVVVMAENEDEMRSVMERLEGYLKRKGVELNSEESKILRFSKGGGRMRKKVWKWKEKDIEEVKEVQYLGYTFQRNGSEEAHVREKIKAVMGQVWGIWKRKFGRDWKKKVWLFDKLVWTVMGYGPEIWGWGKRRAWKCWRRDISGGCWGLIGERRGI